MIDLLIHFGVVSACLSGSTVNFAMKHNDLRAMPVEILAALGLLAYFFFRRRKKARDEAGVQIVELRLEGKLNPDEIRVRAGEPVQLRIHRYERAPKEQLFEIEELEIYEILPAMCTTVISFTPTKRGRFPMILAQENKAGEIVVE